MISFNCNCDILKIFAIVESKKKLGFLFLICRLKENPEDAFCHKNPIYITTIHKSNHLDSIWNGVSINSSVISTECTRETIGIWVACFLAFNLTHSKNVEATLEFMEYGLHLRKTITRKSVTNLLNVFNLS